MSALIRWRCDICGRESETVQQLDRSSLFTLTWPKRPDSWRNVTHDKRQVDCCSHACYIEHYRRFVAREEKKLRDSLPTERAQSA